MKRAFILGRVLLLSAGVLILAGCGGNNDKKNNSLKDDSAILDSVSTAGNMASSEDSEDDWDDTENKPLSKEFSPGLFIVEREDEGDYFTNEQMDKSLRNLGFEMKDSIKESRVLNTEDSSPYPCEIKTFAKDDVTVVTTHCLNPMYENYRTAEIQFASNDSRNKFMREAEQMGFSNKVLPDEPNLYILDMSGLYLKDKGGVYTIGWNP